MKIHLYIQARMGSSRLPGKTMLPLGKMPVLQWVIERAGRAQLIDKLAVLISDLPQDDVVAQFAEHYGCEVIRGSATDLLARYNQAIEHYDPDLVVRITGDCPLTDWKIINSVIRYHLSGGYDYTSNSIEQCLPDGFDVEVFSADVLRQAHKESKWSDEREHLGLFFRNHPARFKIGKWQKFSLPLYRLTLDEPADFKVLETLVAQLGDSLLTYSGIKIVRYLNQHPSVLRENAHLSFNEGLVQSITHRKRII